MNSHTKFSIFRLFTFSNPDDIRSAIIVLLRLPLDKRLSTLSREIEQVLNSLLDMFQEDQWIEQVSYKILFSIILFSIKIYLFFKKKNFLRLSRYATMLNSHVAQ